MILLLVVVFKINAPFVKKWVANPRNLEYRFKLIRITTVVLTIFVSK